MKHYLVLYLATLLLMGLLDFLWIGHIASDFYKTRIGAIFEFHPLPAVLFYFLYVAGIVIFVSGGPDTTYKSVLLYGALLGLLAYGTYDLTNWATLSGWSKSLVVVDMAWGTFTTAAAATGGWFAAKFLVG